MFSQPAGMVNETFNLKYLKIGNIEYYTPNGENPSFAIYENSGDYSFEAGGIFNMMFGSANFSGNYVTFGSIGVTLHDCVEQNCHYENLYFYEVLSNSFMESKTLSYNYWISDGIKGLTIYDANYNAAVFRTSIVPEPDPLLFQTWYLHWIEADMGDWYPIDNDGYIQLTIHPDLTFTGFEGCASVSGDFKLTDDYEGWSDFILVPENYVKDETNCTEGSPTYNMSELEFRVPLRSFVDQYSLIYESSPGFIHYFSNEILSTPENDMSKLNIYPNPVEDKLFIATANMDLNSIVVLDVNGRTVISQKSGDLNEIDVSSLNSGMYFLRMESATGNIVKKFIKN
jgi:heat shock protein HslJ